MHLFLIFCLCNQDVSEGEFLAVRGSLATEPVLAVLAQMRHPSEYVLPADPTDELGAGVDNSIGEVSSGIYWCLCLYNTMKYTCLEVLVSLYYFSSKVYSPYMISRTLMNVHPHECIYHIRAQSLTYL